MSNEDRLVEILAAFKKRGHLVAQYGNFDYDKYHLESPETIVENNITQHESGKQISWESDVLFVIGNLLPREDVDYEKGVDMLALNFEDDNLIMTIYKAKQPGDLNV